MTREELLYKLTGTEKPKFTTEREEILITKTLELINDLEAQLAIDSVSVRSCGKCKNMHYESPQHDQPYPEFWCSMNHWDGITNTAELDMPIECKDYAH